MQGREDPGKKDNSSNSHQTPRQRRYADCTIHYLYVPPLHFQLGSETNMLDAFKNLTGKGKLVQKQTEDPETLIATAREERTAISAMLTARTARSAKPTPRSTSLAP